MANIFKSLDTLGIGDLIKRITLSIRQFFATKSEMDVVTTALTDLDRRINDAMPTISVGKVETVDAGKDAQVTISGTKPNVVLNFSIPRGANGDMYELDDAGYAGDNNNIVYDYCIADRVWQMRTDEKYQFVDKIEVPVPSIESIVMLADCIYQTNGIELSVPKTELGETYVWKQLHWLLRCSRTDCIVYTTKYAIPDANYPSIIDFEQEPNVYFPPSTIEISVSHKKEGARYVQITIENKYGRAYYFSKDIYNKNVYNN